MAQDDNENGTLPLLTPGGRLREARIVAGLELAEIAARTRVSKRHLEAIEGDRYSELASRTYAVGFSKSYARALGLDENAIAQGVRDELARHEDLFPRPQRAENFEPGDPARVPSSSLAWMAAGGAILLFALIFVFWRSFLDPAGSMPELVDDKPRATSAESGTAPRRTATVAPVPAAAAIRLTALEQDVWVKISNAAGEQLFQKELALNESYTLPSGTSGAVLSTARPDALRVSIGARTLERLRATPEILRDISLAPASLLAPPVPAVGPDATPAPTGSGTETSTVSDR